MRVLKRIPWLYGLGMGLAALAFWGTRAGADVTSDRPGSIVIWPKVIADGTRDTIITLTNTSNSTAYAHCEYTQGTGVCSLSPDFCSLTTSNSCPEIPGGGPNNCVILCNTRDFNVTLTHQQPTMWRVSTGRREDLLLGSGTECTTDPSLPPVQNCPGLFMASGADQPNLVPPAPGQANDPSEFGGFRGELRCFETMVDGSPSGADALKGEAIIEGVNAAVTGGPLLSEYNSINVLSGSGTPSDGVLELNGVEYNACPDAIDIIHYAPGAENLVASSIGADCSGGSCDVQTNFTIIPCRRDYENDTPTAFNVHFSAEDEFETQFLSAEVPFECWADVDLATLGFSNINGATFWRTRASSTGSGLCITGPNTNSLCRSDADCGTDGVCGPISGILAVVEEFHPTTRTFTDASLVGSAAANTHEVDTNGDGSLQRLGICRVGRKQCASNADCTGGLCRIAGTACTSNTQCTGSGDFCDLCMNDEITLVGAFDVGQ